MYLNLNFFLIYRTPIIQEVTTVLKQKSTLSPFHGKLKFMIVCKSNNADLLVYY